MPSIESQAAEAAYLILINPEAHAQMQERPELIGYWLEALVPRIAALYKLSVSLSCTIARF